MNKATAIFAVAVFAWADGSLAHGNESHPSAPFADSQVEQKAFGRAGDPQKAVRTMTIRMRDTMRFSPAELVIRSGETIRLRVRNDGRVLHELVLGTDSEIAEHAALMRRFPGMKHDEPHMVHVGPGKTATITWTFNRPGEFRFACLLPGHYEAGMLGRVVVR